MKGSLRVGLGLFITFGAVGGLDNATDSSLLVALSAAVVGLLLMYSGVRAMNRGIDG